MAVSRCAADSLELTALHQTALQAVYMINAHIRIILRQTALETIKTGYHEGATRTIKS